MIGFEIPQIFREFKGTYLSGVAPDDSFERDLAVYTGLA
jgi:hypothetical protein